MKILLTGVAGFIGFHTAKRLISEGHEIVGIDNMNDYYEVSLKKDRLKELGVEDRTNDSKDLKFYKIHLEDRENVEKIFESHDFDVVINLAAQAGVRYSIENPHAYIDSNIVGFLNILEGCRNHNVKHLIYASSSSVYGSTNVYPYKEDMQLDEPISLYAVSKKANELMAHSYTHLYGFQTTGLRFFTVYGPWGRPDMMAYLIAEAIKNKKTIKVFNHGDMLRDFTYIDDIVEGIVRITNKGEFEDRNKYEIYNIGKGSPDKLMDMIKIMEDEFGVEVKKEFLEMQAGDVYKTYADTSKISKHYGYNPSTALKKGLNEFVKWYREYS